MPGGTICKVPDGSSDRGSATVGDSGFGVYQDIDDHLKNHGWTPTNEKLDSDTWPD